MPFVAASPAYKRGACVAEKKKRIKKRFLELATEKVHFSRLALKKGEK